MTLNEMLRQGEEIYFTPFHVWTDIYQPDPKDVMANPPYNV